MQIPILIEPVAGNGYRSRGGEPYALSAEGSTREEVMSKLRQQLDARLHSGTHIVSLDISPEPAPNPWVEFAGMFKDDPMFENWQESIAEYRREVDADPNYL